MAKAARQIAPTPAQLSLTAFALRHPEVAKEQRRFRKERAETLARWHHKNHGTPETHEHAARTRQGALARMYEGGQITIDELAWAHEIQQIGESIERDVAIQNSSYETRIDRCGRPSLAIIEGLNRIRREQAYGYWRFMLPKPKAMILDMVLHDVGFTVAARVYRVHNRKAKRYLVAAIDRWPFCLELAARTISRDDARRSNARLA